MNGGIRQIHARFIATNNGYITEAFEYTALGDQRQCMKKDLLRGWDFFIFTFVE